jgi:hypothetical protein
VQESPRSYIQVVKFIFGWYLRHSPQLFLLTCQPLCFEEQASQIWQLVSSVAGCGRDEGHKDRVREAKSLDPNTLRNQTIALERSGMGQGIYLMSFQSSFISPIFTCSWLLAAQECTLSHGVSDWSISFRRLALCPPSTSNFN